MSAVTMVAPVALILLYLLWWSHAVARRVASLERNSRLDPLTGLGSGHWLDSERWQAALRSGRPLGVVYIDLDQLRERNNREGHAAGDRYISAAADALRSACRRGIDEVFRAYTKGDEFLILLHGPLAEPAKVAGMLLSRLRTRGVLASIGLAYTTETRFLPARANLRGTAEALCRRAKEAGGDCSSVTELPPHDDDGHQLAPPVALYPEPGGAVPEHIPEEVQTAPIKPGALSGLVARTVNP